MGTGSFSLPDTPTSFGAWMRQQRRKLDLTQAQLAHQAGCARVTIRKLEAEEMRPSRQLAQVIAEALGIPAAEQEAFVRLARASGTTEEWTQLQASAPTLSVKHNLPLQLTSFVGRQEEIAEVRHLIAGGRLLTLTGPGGIGKTRLALQVANELLDNYQDGVWWVDLAPLADPTLVPQEVASVLGVRELQGRSLVETLMSHLSNKRALLVLDNCEHMVSAVGSLATALLQRAQHLCILATSRESLRVAGERTWRVPSLSVPTPALLESKEETGDENALNILSRYESVALFTQRASMALRTFTWSRENARSVVQVCRRLDGIPLAIELAAARTKVLSVQQIADRLDDSFALLTGGSRTDVPHHQTLRSAMDWSYQLLSEKEQILLCRLSVFAGGFTPDAAEEVCADHALAQNEILDLLSSLHDKSLVEVEQMQQVTRGYLLETVRHYAAEKSAEKGETERLRGQHLDFYMRMAEQAEPKLQTAEQSRWLARLDVEADNLRGALGWSLRHGNENGEDLVEKGVRLAGALWQFWLVRGHMKEGRRWLALAVEHSSGNKLAAGRARAKALVMAVCLADFHGDLSSNIPLCQEALEIARRLGDQQIIATALMFLGDYQARYEYSWPRTSADLTEALSLARQLGDNWLTSLALELSGSAARSRGDLRTAKSLFEESLAQSREVGDPWLISGILDNLGSLEAMGGNYERAALLYDEGLKLRRELRDSGGVAGFLNDMGQMARYQQDYARAAQYLDESLALFKENGQKESTGIVLRNLAWVVRHQGDLDRARALFRESLSIFRELENMEGIVYSLAGMAVVTCDKGQAHDAVKLFTAVDVLFHSTGVALPHSDLAEYARMLREARADLSPSAFAAARAEGQALDLAQTISYALAGATGDTRPDVDGSRSPWA